jgi:hypothetical protein
VSSSVVVIPSIARADDLFSLSASSTSGPPASATASAARWSTSSGPDRIQIGVSVSSEHFADGSLRYAGLNNALQFTRSADGTQATLHITSTGFTKTFTGTSEHDVNSQVRHFVLQAGANQYAKFLQKSTSRRPSA